MNRLLKIFCFLLVLISTPAFAWIHGTTAGSGPNQTTQINLGAADYPGAFINFLKTYNGVNFGTESPSSFDANGYPDMTLSANVGGAIAMPSGFAGNSTQWIVKWPASCTLKFVINNPTNKVSSSNATVTGGTASSMTITGNGSAGNVVFTFSNFASSSVSFYFPSGFANSCAPGGLALLRVSDQIAYDAGAIFTPEFLTLVGNLHPNTIRTMGWTGVNLSNEVQWRYRTSPISISWQASTYPPDTWGGTVSGTNTYTIGPAPDTPVTLTGGEVIQGVVTNANTSTTPTLDVNSRGVPKTIVNLYGLALTTSCASNPNNCIQAGTLATFVYDGVLDKWLYSNGGVTASIPIEAQVALANSLNTNLWTNAPSMVDDTYLTTWATYVRDNLAPRLLFYPEYGNELWNFQFPGTQWGFQRGLVLGWPNTNNEPYQGWYGLRTAQLNGTIIPAVFSGQMSRVRRVMMFQGGGDSAQISKYRLKGFDLAGNTYPNVGTTITIASPAVLTFAGNGLQAGWAVIPTTTGTLPTGLTSGTTYYVVNPNNSGCGSNDTCHYSLAATPGGAAINTTGTQSGTHTITYTNTYYPAAGYPNYNMSPNRPVDFVEAIGYAPYAGGTNLCTGIDIGCTPNSTNASFYQNIVTTLESGNIGAVAALVDDDIQQGLTLKQTVTASGTIFTTPLAHGFTANSTDIAFTVASGTNYSGLTNGALYRVTSTPTSTTFTMQPYVAGSPSGANVNAGTAGTGTVTVGASLSRNLLNLSNTWYLKWEALAASFDNDRPLGALPLRMEQYEGAIEPQGLTASQCTSLGIVTNPVDPTGTLCASEIAAAITAWKNDASAALRVAQYFNQFMGRDPAMVPTYGLMSHSKYPSWLTITGPNIWSLLPGDIFSSPYQTYNGFAQYNFLLKRDLDPALNDNDPVWLGKVA